MLKIVIGGIMKSLNIEESYGLGKYAPSTLCHPEHLLCHSELVSESNSKQILNQVQNDKNFERDSVSKSQRASAGRVMGQSGLPRTHFVRARNDGGINNRKELINLSTYPPIHFKKAAFTLAETLITIGIIGVVSALTIPMFISNYRKHALVIAIDANGDKKPNVIGKDIYIAVWSEKGLVPAGYDKTKEEVDSNCLNGNGYFCLSQSYW